MAIRADPTDAKAAAAVTKKPVCKQKSLHSLPLPGSYDPGTTSSGEHTVPLMLEQRHADLCHLRLTTHSVPLPPLGLSEPEPPNQLFL